MAGVQDNLPTDAVVDGEQDQHSNAETLSTDDGSTDHSSPVDLSDAFPISDRPKSEPFLRPSTRETILFLNDSATELQTTREVAHLSLPPPHKSSPALAAAAPEVQNAPEKKATSIVGTLSFLKKNRNKKKTTTQNVLETQSTETFYVALWRCSADADNELSFEKGDRLRIVDAQHEARGWLLAELDGNTGLVPINYLRKCS